MRQREPPSPRRQPRTHGPWSLTKAGLVSRRRYSWPRTAKEAMDEARHEHAALVDGRLRARIRCGVQDAERRGFRRRRNPDLRPGGREVRRSARTTRTDRARGARGIGARRRRQPHLDRRRHSCPGARGDEGQPRLGRGARRAARSAGRSGHRSQSSPVPGRPRRRSRTHSPTCGRSGRTPKSVA